MDRYHRLIFRHSDEAGGSGRWIDRPAGEAWHLSSERGPGGGPGIGREGSRRAGGWREIIPVRRSHVTRLATPSRTQTAVTRSWAAPGATAGSRTGVRDSAAA